ncbi:hypothetical protein R6Q59_034641 [Mikania micrantha]
MASHLLSLLWTTTSFVGIVWAGELICVANLSLPANNDGVYSCKDPKFLHANDFSFSRLRFPTPTTSMRRKRVLTTVFDRELPGLNTLGISMLLFDFAVGDFVAPHVHFRGTEIFMVLRGSILVSFNISAPIHRQYTKVIRAGDVFVIPKGLYHSQKNVGNIDSTVIAAFNCQNPDGVPSRR